MDKRFIVVSGLPASGKSTLARRLAPALGLPLLDKDEILERLFDLSGNSARTGRTAEPDTVAERLDAAGRAVRELSGNSARPGRTAEPDTVAERLDTGRRAVRALNGVGDSPWRRALSRQSDSILRTEASASEGAILVSHWHLPGMNPDSGTPVGWLAELPGKTVNVHCVCDAEVAAARFIQRRRHPGHRDGERPDSEVLASIRAVAMLGQIDIGPRVFVDTSHEPDIDVVLRQIQDALQAIRRPSPGTRLHR